MTRSRSVLASISAVFMRGGTSKALFFRRTDLPENNGPMGCVAWDKIFCGALGTPDPNGRQLDGMGGGLSSLSKIAIIGPPSRPDADVDFTFAQVGIKESVVSYRGTCGNITSAVGPFAVDEGLVRISGERASVRIHNTNTSKIVVADFALTDGRSAVEGDLEIAGVAGFGSPIRLSFLDPGGGATGLLLPTRNARDVVNLKDFGKVEVSLVDASNPTVFVRARSFGLTGLEAPAELENNTETLALLDELRIASSVAMGLCPEDEARHTVRNLPLVSIIADQQYCEKNADVTTRMISAGQPHRAIPLTGAMCLAVAARIPGSIVEAALDGEQVSSRDLAIAHASGVLKVGAIVKETDGTLVAEEVIVNRTARRLMDGRVFYRSTQVGSNEG
jgi:2-methylaconitate isomerase